jgi:hypothetical protein
MTALQPLLIESAEERALWFDEAMQDVPPVERVQVRCYPDGWQVIVHMDSTQHVLPTVYAEMYDAEQAAVAIALQYDLTLCLDGDPDGEIADGLLQQRLWIDELRDAESRWTL